MRREFRNFQLVVLLAVLSVDDCLFAENADSYRTGRYTLSNSIKQVLGEDGAKSYSEIFPVDEIQEWEIVVPENHDPDNPAGVLVYISPTNSGRIPGKWKAIVESENLIWIAANRSGNNTAVSRRIAYALLSVGIIDDRYNINASRVYLAGFSGGARVSGLVAASYPGLFTGAIYIGGAELWNQANASIDLEAMQKNRYVFIAGSNDFNRSMARNVFSKYGDLGIENIDFVLMSRKGHELPNTRQMLEAVRFLDADPG